MSELNKWIGRDKYPDNCLLSTEEIENLCRMANELMGNMNGDTNSIELTLRQFHILMVAAFTGGPVWETQY